jgi:WhiB family transcriptional regulator, redox-sensing transcriptional regulator
VIDTERPAPHEAPHGRSQRLPCEDGDPELWFAEREDDLELAKQLCRCCPLRRDCLTDAMGRREPWGVWGGEILIRGSVVATKRGRGRPRSSAPIVAHDPALVARPRAGDRTFRGAGRSTK